MQIHTVFLAVALAAIAPVSPAIAACSVGFVERFDQRGNAECIPESQARTQKLGSDQADRANTLKMQNDMRRLQRQLPQMKEQMRQRRIRDALLREQRQRTLLQRAR